MRAIIRKELADHFSSTRFPLLSALIIMSALAGAYLAGEGIRVWLGQGLGLFLEGRLFLLLFSAPGAGLPVYLLIGYLGPLLALLLGFDAVNRERKQGTLAKILSQPVFRDELLAGKYLAGLITLAVISAALFLLITGLGLAVVGLAPGPAELARLFLFWLISVVYLGFWLGLGLLMSVVCRSPAASALACAALWLFLVFFLNFLAAGLAGSLKPSGDPLRPSREELLARETLSRRLSLLSPASLYSEAGAFLLNPSSRSLNRSLEKLDPAVNHRYTGRFSGPLDLWPSLVLVLPHLAALLALSGLVFALCRLFFIGQEIRSGP